MSHCFIILVSPEVMSLSVTARCDWIFRNSRTRVRHKHMNKTTKATPAPESEDKSTALAEGMDLKRERLLLRPSLDCSHYCSYKKIAHWNFLSREKQTLKPKWAKRGLAQPQHWMTMASKGLYTHGGPRDCISQCHWCHTIVYVHSVVASQLNAFLTACPHSVTKWTFKSPIVWRHKITYRDFIWRSCWKVMTSIQPS